jgi:hypothetical protein
MKLCRITISGRLDEVGRKAFGDFDIEEAGEYTVLICEADQSTVRGVLSRLRPLGLQVVDLSSPAVTNGPNES